MKREGLCTRLCSESASMREFVSSSESPVDEVGFTSKALTGVPFPKNFLQICKKILCRLFRVFVHVYIHHFDRVIVMGAEAHVNTCYKHFYYFVTEMNLIDRKELEPLPNPDWKGFLTVGLFLPNPTHHGRAKEQKQMGENSLFALKELGKLTGSIAVSRHQAGSTHCDSQELTVCQQEDGGQERDDEQDVSLTPHLTLRKKEESCFLLESWAGRRETSLAEKMHRLPGAGELETSEFGLMNPPDEGPDVTPMAGQLVPEQLVSEPPVPEQLVSEPAGV
ncbi:hypothetical protein CB1_001279011 [Camelus ferus]|nr:hypothetical protein CB1_001279011 [Camelus ferus]